MGLCPPAWEHELSVQPHREAGLHSTGKMLVTGCYVGLTCPYCGHGTYIGCSWPCFGRQTALVQGAAWH